MCGCLLSGGEMQGMAVAWCLYHGDKETQVKGGGSKRRKSRERDQRERVNGVYTIGVPNMAEAGRRVRQERSEVENR